MTPLRVALAVVLACALAIAAAPAVEDARAANAAHSGQRAADDVRDAVVALASSTPAPRDAPAATRTVTVSLPPPDAATARTALRVGAGPGDTESGDVLVVTGGDRTRQTTLPVDVRVVANGAVAADDTGLRVSKRATLTLRYVRHEGRPTVLVAAESGAEVYTRGRAHGGT